MLRMSFSVDFNGFVFKRGYEIARVQCGALGQIRQAYKFRSTEFHMNTGLYRNVAGTMFSVTGSRETGRTRVTEFSMLTCISSALNQSPAQHG